MIEVGTATVDITPNAGLSMAGFAVRTKQANGAHDPLSARALVVDNTAIVIVDVIGIDAALSLQVRTRCSLPNHAVTILATHTHGGPASMPGRLWVEVDSAFMQQLENGIVEVIEQAIAAKQPARIFGGNGVDPGYAKNRRQNGGPVDGVLPILRFDSAEGLPIAIMTSYACHPVVLGADNLTYTSDYPHFVRTELEARYPGAVALFVTGCAGDVNTGHSAASSLSRDTRPERSFSMARTIGQDVARSVISTQLTELSGGLGTAEIQEQLHFQQREVGVPDDLVQQWQADAAGDDPVAHIWAKWAESVMGQNIDPVTVRCTAFYWSGAQIIALPGEVFAQTALEIRQALPTVTPLFVLAYADDNPGYIPHITAYREGGYEVDEAHRFYGQGATFAPGSAECLVDAGCKVARMAARAATDDQPTEVKATEGRML